MALSITNIKRWYLMLSGKSVFHVNQDIGKHFDKNHIRGYYNNMIEKVTKAPEYVDSDSMPSLKIENGIDFLFPVGIFQYAFGLLDLYYETNDKRYINKFKDCADWAIAHQLKFGAWDNFSYYYPNNPYGAMAQGEGASLLVRAYILFNNIKYLDAAKKAIDFMLIDKNHGGCTSYERNQVVLLEYPHRKAVMNGWIFAWWGLYDYVLVTHEESNYRELMNKSCKSLMETLPQFKNSYWSIYDLEGRIASPFYHNLHIAQMQAMYILTGETIFKNYAETWIKQQKSFFCKSLAFIKKSYQKIKE